MAPVGSKAITCLLKDVSDEIPRVFRQRSKLTERLFWQLGSQLVKLSTLDVADDYDQHEAKRPQEISGECFLSATDG